MTGRRTMVSINTVDRLVGLFVIILVLLGGYSGWLAARQMARRSRMMGMMPGMNPVWYLFGTLLVVSVVIGVYILSREHLADALSDTTTSEGKGDGPDGDEGQASPVNPLEDSMVQSDSKPDTSESISPGSNALTFLPEDERRVVEPVLESPGLTQVELRARSDFSKAKVSQTVSELEDRGLVYREKQGRTYRVFPGELLKED